MTNLQREKRQIFEYFSLRKSLTLSVVLAGEESRHAHRALLLDDCSIRSAGFGTRLSDTGLTTGATGSSRDGGGGIGRCSCLCFSSFSELSRSRIESAR